MDVSRKRDFPAEQSATEAVTGVRPKTLNRATRGTKEYILYIDSREKFRPL
jgi:hypothetical protein